MGSQSEARLSREKQVCPTSKGREVTDFKELTGEDVVVGKKFEVTGETSDGYHTFNELYDHRTMLMAVLMNTEEFCTVSWRSRQHHVGGAPMFDGMFIVGMNLHVGQVTYHIEDKHWDLFNGVETLENAPEWDGHTSGDVLERLRMFT